MAFWIELRCDVRRDGCYSNQNNGPTKLAGSTRQAVKAAISQVEQDALLQMWRHHHLLGWACPSCRKETGL
jgi:hypothetical protein